MYLEEVVDLVMGFLTPSSFLLYDKYLKSYDVSRFQTNLDGYGLPARILLGPTYVGSVLRAGLFLNIHFVLSVAEIGCMNHFCSQFKYGQERRER